MNSIQEISNKSFVETGRIDYVLYDLVDTSFGDLITSLFGTFHYYPWIFSLIGSMLVGLSGIFPLLVIPLEGGEALKFGTGANRLRVLLSFAVGGLLGDVFLHLLPEAWEHGLKSGSHSHPSLFSGVWVLIGMLAFIIVEKLSSSIESNAGEIESEEYVKSKDSSSRSSSKDKFRRAEKKNKNLVCINNNNVICENKKIETKERYHISGYLNLMANTVDNFTHGLAIGGSFSISFKMGVLSTFAILVHELPHEIGDFAILLKSGFSRWDAAKAQLCTAFAGIMGAMFAVIFGSSDSIENKTSWILPFTAGGFLHIALVTVLPELVQEESKSESWKQLCSLFFGIVVMAFVIGFFE